MTLVLALAGSALTQPQFPGWAWADLDIAASPDAMFYRQFALKVRPTSAFRVPVPGNPLFGFRYQLKSGAPLFQEPLIGDFFLDPKGEKFFRNFWDKVSVQDGSLLQLGDEQVPLTCIFINGQDNRFSQKDSPLIPDFFLKVYLVANDFNCKGPINPGWPNTSGKKETWDTYVYFEVRDPTIMLPTEIKLRYRWAEYVGYLVDDGGGK